MIIAVIPAREGSKRLPGKNLMMLDGRPLITYSILLARSIPEIDLVVVASDGQQILDVGKEWGASVLKLPPELTGDASTLVGSLKYVVDHPALQVAEGVDWAVLFQPVCPLRLVNQCRSWIRQVLEKERRNRQRNDAVYLGYGGGTALSEHYCDGLLTVDSDTYKLGHPDIQGYYSPEYEPGIIKQHVQPKYRENGLLYVLKADNIRHGILFGPRMLMVECRREQSLCNIDYQFDFELTKWAFDHFGYRTEFDQLEERLGVGHQRI